MVELGHYHIASTLISLYTVLVRQLHNNIDTMRAIARLLNADAVENRHTSWTAAQAAVRMKASRGSLK